MRVAIRSSSRIEVGLRDVDGFTIAELIVGVGLLSLLVLLSVGTVVAAKRLMPGRVIQIEGEYLPVAPSPSAFADAVRFHSVFMDRLSTAKAVYVFGGLHHGLPVGASRLGNLPLAANALPRSAGFSEGLPLDSYAFYARYAEKIGGKFEGATPTDFTVLTIGPVDGKLAVTSLLQVRGVEVSVSDGHVAERYQKRSATLYDLSGDTKSYVFLEKAATALSAGVGARHFWYRYSEGYVAEEAPTVVVFPDPSLYAGMRLSASRPNLPSFSRFTYVLALSL